MTTDPNPSVARFKVGDSVWAFNGQPRIVTGMRWCAAMKRDAEDVAAGIATGLADPDAPDLWGWSLDTVDPDDPSCVGTGFEESYRPRTSGEPSPGAMGGIGSIGLSRFNRPSLETY